MHVAEIVPLKFLELTKDNYYHMCLAQLVLKSEEYADFYRRMSDEGKYVIVDNGACEGEVMTPKDLIKVYNFINPTEIVLPDVLFDSYTTMDKVEYFFTIYGSELSRFKKMIVPQGKDWMEWLWCLSEMSKFDYFEEVTTIGIPKWLDKCYSLRPYICKILKRDFPDKEIHLLGCGSNPAVLIPECRHNNSKVRGCDSAFAYLCSKAGVETINKFTARPDVTIDFLNDTAEKSPLEKMMSEFENIAGVKNNKEK